MYHFRLIGASDYLMHFSIVEHLLQVIGADGYLIQLVMLIYVNRYACDQEFRSNDPEICKL